MKTYNVKLTKKQILFLYSHATREEMKAEECKRPEAAKFARDIQDALVEATAGQEEE